MGHLIGKIIDIYLIGRKLKFEIMKIPKILTIKKNHTIEELYKTVEKVKLNNAISKYAIYFDKQNRVKGIISLGDLRRILRYHKLSTNVRKIVNYNPVTVFESDLNNNLINLVNEKFKKRKLTISDIFVLNKDRTLNKIIEYSDIKNNFIYKKVCIIGLGHIGMTLLFHILKKFSHISGYDINLEKIKNIKKSKLNFYEKNIDAQSFKSLIQKRILLSNKLSELKAQIYIVCVGSEINTSGKINNDNLIDIFKKLALVIKKDDLVILRGTVQIGITRSLLIRILEKRSGLNCGKDFFLSYMPERIVEGDALNEFEKIPQLVSGYTEKCLSLSLEFSNIIFNSSLELKSIEEGEIIKLASNSYRDLSFAFSNEVSRISEIYHLSGSKLIEKANFGYERNNFQKPSTGVGGFCLPKDPFLFSKLYKNKKIGYRFTNLSRKINDSSIIDAVNKIENYKKKYFGKNKKLKILIYGLAFKGFPETIDIRNSPAIELFKLLKESKYIIRLHDVLGKKILLNKTELKPVILSKVKNLNTFDVIILINNHNYYQDQIKKYLKKNNSNSKKLVFDVWNLLNQSYIESQNWIYQNI